VNGVAVGLERNANDLRCVEIGGGTSSRQAMGLVRFADVIGLFVILREDGVDTDAQFGGATSDSDRNFAAVGDEEVLECHGFTRRFATW
jgi:hypothetical protein